jgi:glycosyltransferase involved in cell wall biosynthesis
MQSERRTSTRPRVAVLWAELSGYVNAQLSALVDHGAEVVVVHEISSSQAPFDLEAVTRGLEAHAWSGAPDEAKVEAILEEFQPDALMVISWHIGAYRRIARRWRGRALRVLCQSNQWWGTPKQWGGVALSRFVIRPTYDVALVTGERQADFARRLGFTHEQLIWGMNTGDAPRFAEVAADRKGELPPEAFLYVGRLVPDKAIDVLAEGYRRYRERVAEPWPLLVAGTGPESHHLLGVDGVEMLGFVQPHDLPATFARAGCLVLPSRFEPWAVVIHEAAAAGLPIVCTWVCGAATRLVLDGYNGVVMSPDSPEAVAVALARISTATPDERRAMGEGSTTLARQYSPDRWASNLLRRLDQLVADVDLVPLPESRPEPRVASGQARR